MYKSRCSNDNDENQFFSTKNATIYYYLDLEFGSSQCEFVIEINNNEICIPNTKF